MAVIPAKAGIQKNGTVEDLSRFIENIKCYLVRLTMNQNIPNFVKIPHISMIIVRMKNRVRSVFLVKKVTPFE